MSKSLLQKFLKEIKLHSFNLRLLQTLELGESMFMDFADESSFCTNRDVSFQNMPIVYSGGERQRYENFNVWCGILVIRIVGSYLIEGN